jgi:hypothetical protein
MTRENLKAEIKETFGTYSNFCRLAGIDRYKFQRDFLQAFHVEPKEVKRIAGIVAGLKDSAVNKANIVPKLKSLREAIKASGGVKAFCRKNKKFKAGSVYNALYNRPGYMSVATKLLKHFGYE